MANEGFQPSAAGPDPCHADSLGQRQIRKLRDQFELTVVLVEHNMSVVMSVCESIHVMDHGETITEGPPAKIQAHPRVLAAYLGQEYDDPNASRMRLPELE